MLTGNRGLSAEPDLSSPSKIATGPQVYSVIILLLNAQPKVRKQYQTFLPVCSFDYKEGNWVVGDQMGKEIFFFFF